MKKREKFIIEIASIFAAAIGTLLLSFLLLHWKSSPSKPEFLNISEYEMIEEYIADTEEQQTELARIVDSRKLSEEELKLFDKAIVELGETVDALENILEARED